MKPVLVVFGTRFGTSRKIAGRLAARLARRHVPVALIDASDEPRSLDLEAHAAVVVVASVHTGKHQPEVVAFARAHRASLERLPTVLVSVSLAAAVADDVLGLPTRRAAAHADVLGALATFVADTGWTPRRMEPIAGALTYRAYPFVLRQLMRLIAWRLGAPTDTSRDHELTDWKAVDRLADQIAELVVPRAAPTEAIAKLCPSASVIWN